MTETSIRSEIRGRGVPLRGDDIDTDRIIPARFLMTVTFDDLGAHAFEDDRASGKHPLDRPGYQGGKILIVNSNFGCGSSREHAPQALMRWGIAAFVGQSFAEIFFGNCVALGLPCLTAPPKAVMALQEDVEREPGQELVLDIAARTVAHRTGVLQGNMPAGVRDQFLQGTWDALGQLLGDEEQIEATARSLPYTTGFQS